MIKNLGELQKKQIFLDKLIYQQAKVDWKWFSLVNAKRIKLNILVEIGELSNEIKSFKMWRKKDPVNLAKIKEELIDCFCFFLGLTSIYQINLENWDFKTDNKKVEFNDLLLDFFTATEKLYIIEKEDFYDSTKKNNLLLNTKELSTYHNWLKIFYKISSKLEMEDRELSNVYLWKNEINHQRVNKGGH